MSVQETLKNYKELLRNNKNLILTGAPGTGKTYLARQIAMHMIFKDNPEKAVFDSDELEETDKKLFDEHFAFVQFHPSYDYTDFVEGLRPVALGDNRVDFTLKTVFSRTFAQKRSPG